MVACASCNTKNSLDSRYCKSCGKELESNAREKAQQELDVLIAEGFRIFNDGKIEEAALVAQTVLEQEPESVSALSLKAMCKEHEGQIAEALDLYEKVLALKPDSALDRIKVTHLRNSIATKLSAPAASPDRKTAVIGAVAATVLVVSVGIALAGFMNQNGGKNTALDTQEQSKPIQNANLDGQAPSNVNPGIQTPDESNKQPETAAQPSVTPANNSGSSAPGVRFNEGAVPLILNPEGGTIPQPTVGAPSGGDANKTPASDESTKNKPREDGGIDPVVNGPKGNGKDGSQQGRNAIYEINFSRGNGGGSEGGNDSQTSETLVRTGLAQFQSGRFQNAARSFEGALRAGADPGKTNQRLAQCYQNLNQDKEALAAYQRAISAFESQVKSGKGGASAKAAIESCKAAIQVLSGGGT